MLEKFIIGQIGAPFGVKGFVKVRSSSGETDHFLKLQSVIISKDGREQTLQIEEIAVSVPPIVNIKFKGIDSPEAAKTLTGAQLIADRGEAAPLGDGEFYIEDLKGMSVQSDKGELIGNITDIVEGGGGELVEIKLISNGEKRFVPFRKEFFTEIDPENGKLVLHEITIALLFDNARNSREMPA